MTSDRVAALFVVGRHSFAGGIEHQSSRVLDVLTDANSEFLRVYDVSVGVAIEGAPLAVYDEVIVPKSKVDCVMLTDDRHEAPLQRQYARVEKRTHEVFLLVGDCEIRGTAMFARAADPVAMLGSGASTFFPIVAAKVSSAGSANRPISAGVVFVNKTNVSLLHVER